MQEEGGRFVTWNIPGQVSRSTRGGGLGWRGCEQRPGTWWRFRANVQHDPTQGDADFPRLHCGSMLILLQVL